MKSFNRILFAALAGALLVLSCGRSKAPAGESFSDEDLALMEEVRARHDAFVDSLQALTDIMDQNALYIKYNRECRVFIAKHPDSKALVDVLLQVMPDGETPVFFDIKDAIMFNNVYDHLSELYPDSEHVRKLGDVAALRKEQLEFQYKLDNAQQIGYIDIALKDDDSKVVRLSEVEGRLVMVYFWTMSDSRQLMYSRNVLLPVYEKYHSRGFEVYSVSLDMDRISWAKDVYEQKYPWVQVNDPAGPASSYVGYYNIQSLPWAVFIKDGEVVPAQIGDQASLEKFIASQL